MFVREVPPQELESDPYPIYKELRDRDPVAFVPALGMWLVTRWDDVVRMDKEHDVFSAALAPSAINRTLGPTMMHATAIDHRRVRPALADPLRRAALRADIFPRVVEVANDLISGIAAEDGVDLIGRFAEPLVVNVVARTLGLPISDERRLIRWFDDFAAGGSNFAQDRVVQQRADDSAAEFNRAIGPLVDGELEPPTGSVLHHVLELRRRGYEISRAEILANLKLCVLGGMQEPRDLIGTTIYALLSHPTQRDEVERDAKLLKRAIEETLRWQSPVGTITRRVTRPVKLAEVDLPVDAHVAGVIASANRDERHWSDPDGFDIHRKEGGHLAFAVGSHTCIGAALGRYITHTAISLLLERIPRLRLDPSDPPVIRGWEFRGPSRLPVITVEGGG